MRPTLHLCLFALSAFGFNDSAVAPQTEKMEPRVGKPGTILKIMGKSLDKTHVDEVYLTDHRFDMKVKILEQTATVITVRVPPFVKPGRLQLLFLTAGSRPVYLEQPLFLLVEAGDEEISPPPAAEISQQRSKPTVEVATTGTSIPVPLAGTPPSPTTAAAVEKSVVPLKTAPPADPAPAPAPTPVQTAPKEIASALQPKPEPPPPGPVQNLVQTPTVQATKPAESAPITQETHIATPVPTPPTPAVSTSPNVPAQVVRRSRIAYPQMAMAQRVEGLVELIAIIRIDGRVKDVKIVKGNPLLASPAALAVREWIYEPAYIQGKPVESEVPIILNFKRP